MKNEKEVGTKNNEQEKWTMNNEKWTMKVEQWIMNDEHGTINC